MEHDDNGENNTSPCTAIIMERAREEIQPADMEKALVAHFKVFAKLRRKTLDALLRRNNTIPSSLRKLFARIADTGLAITRMACVKFLLPGDQTEMICSAIISLATSNEIEAGDDDIDTIDTNTGGVDAELVAELDDLRASLDGAHAELDKTRAHLNDREAEVERVCAKLDHARATLEKKETRIASLQEEVDRERERRRSEVDKFDEKFRGERRRCDELERELRQVRETDAPLSSGEMQSKLDEIAKSKRHSDETIKTLTEKLDDMMRERNRLLLRCELDDSEKQALLQKVRRLEDRLQPTDLEGVGDGTTDDDNNADAIDFPAGIKRNLQDYKRRVQKMRKRVTDWQGVNVSWANIRGALIQIIKWRYIGAPGHRPTSRYKSFQSTSIALVAFFLAFGVGHVVSNVPLDEDEQAVVFTNIDLIVEEIKKACDKDIIFGNANVLAINAKKHVPAIWQKLEDVKRSGNCTWRKSSETPNSSKNLHVEQKKLYESLFIEMKSDDDDVIVIE